MYINKYKKCGDKMALIIDRKFISSIIFWGENFKFRDEESEAKIQKWNWNISMRRSEEKSEI